MPTVTYEAYDTTEAALASFGKPVKMCARDVTKVCRRIAAAFRIETRGSGCSLYGLTSHVFDQVAGNKGRILTKSIKLVQTPTSIVFFSDSYHENADAMEAFVSKCARAGLTVTAFMKDYPGAKYGEGYIPPPKSNVVSYGYDQFYRGSLVGVCVSV